MKIEAKKSRRIDIKKGRKVKIIHSLDGCYYPVFPKEILRIAKDLVGKIDFSSVDYLLCFATYGIVLGVAISIVTKKPLRIAYKKKLDLEEPIIIFEPHSPRKALFLYGARRGDKVVLIDDEVYSGDLFVNAVRALTQRGLRVVSLISLIENTRYDAREKLKKIGFTLKSYRKFNF